LSSSNVDKLADVQHVTVILRLALNRRGRLLHGELVHTEETKPRRFEGWIGLTHTLREWLASQLHDNPSTH